MIENRCKVIGPFDELAEKSGGTEHVGQVREIGRGVLALRKSQFFDGLMSCDEQNRQVVGFGMRSGGQ
ncbi:hypothetical protein D3C71_1034100 [compost metagenome]